VHLASAGAGGLANVIPAVVHAAVPPVFRFSSCALGECSLVGTACCLHATVLARTMTFRPLCLSSCRCREHSTYTLRELTYSAGVLKSVSAGGAGYAGKGNTVERVVILGVPAPTTVVARAADGTVGWQGLGAFLVLGGGGVVLGRFVALCCARFAVSALFGGVWA
jgi:hypothetical protein